MATPAVTNNIPADTLCRFRALPLEEQIAWLLILLGAIPGGQLPPTGAIDGPEYRARFWAASVAWTALEATRDPLFKGSLPDYDGETLAECLRRFHLYQADLRVLRYGGRL